jgi:rsbT antagonist protein RsbS
LSESGSVTRIPLQVSRQYVVASIQVDLSEEVLDLFRTDLLELVGSSGASGVILDLSGVEVMDFQDFDALRRIIAMAKLMGSRTVLSGLKAGVVSSLVELEADTEDIVAALDLDDAFRIMEELRIADLDPHEDDDGE